MSLGLSAHLLEEGFENCVIDSITGNTIIPGGWQIIDNDGDSFSWYEYQYTPHGGLKSLASESWKAAIGALTPDNWLVSPAVTVSDSTDLYWWIATQDASFPAESYGVFLSTTGNALEDFTVELFSETLQAQNISWEQRGVSLAEFDGETVYLAWRHYNCTDNYKLKLDDILVTNENVDNDITNLAPQVSVINQIYPNPFNPETNISFFVTEPGQVDLSVYNIKGQLVANLVNGDRDQGNHKITWRAGSQPSGMYFFRLTTPTGTSSSKAILLK
jgi:hypothetical protein